MNSVGGASFHAKRKAPARASIGAAVRGRGDLQSLLGPAPLLEGEDADAYHALYGHIRAAVEPKDAIGEIWVPRRRSG
jgi:hypothetical protein